MDLDEVEALGLYDPRSEGADDRLAMLGFLQEQGVTLKEMAEANRRGRLAGLAGDRTIRPAGKRITQREAADRAGVAPEAAARLWRACGFPEPEADAATFTEADVESIRVFAAANTLFGEQVALQLARVCSSSLARIAEATISAVGTYRDAPLIEADASELEAAQASAANAAFLPLWLGVIENLFRRHVEAANDRRFELAFPVPGANTVDLAVGFADLAGYTSLAEQLSTHELAAATAEFELRASDQITTRGGRLVKLIGDEVMFVAGDAVTGCEILLDLVDAFSDHDVLPPVRGGLAVGEVLARDGDYFGPVVNLASRAVALAPPGAVLVTEEVRRCVADASDAYRFRSTGERRLKGLSAPVRLSTVRSSRGR